MGDDPHDVIDRHRARLGKPLLERVAADVRDGQERLPIRLAGLEDRDEVLVSNLAGGTRLVHEPLAERLVARELRAQDLQRDLVALGFAEGAEDDPHGSLAELFLETVGTDPRARFQVCHGREDTRAARREPYACAGSGCRTARWPRTRGSGPSSPATGSNG